MTFYYTKNKLLITAILRSIPVLFFYYIALVMGPGFYIGVAILLIEAIVEVYLLYKKGYAKIDGNEITRRKILSTEQIDIQDVHNVFVYDDEWAFRGHDNEVRVDKKLVREDQREVFTQMVEELRNKVLARKKA